MQIKRSKFDHTHVNSTTFKMGYVIPAMISECLPGDTWQGNTQLFMRVAPLVAPLMHRVNITSVTCFIPHRVAWSDFTKFITGGPDGEDDSTPPYVMIKPEQGSLADYLGLPLTENPIKVSALPFRSYAMVWNWMFRDQDLQDELPVSLESGEDTTTSLELQRGNWAKDYFTTARPKPQKGPGITIPLVGDGGIVATGPMKFALGDPEQVITNDTTLAMSRLSVAGGLGFFGFGYGNATSTQGNMDGQYNQARASGQFNNTTGDRNSSAAGYGLSYLDPAYQFSFPDSTKGVKASALTYLSGLGVGTTEEGSIGIDVNDLLEALALQRFQTRRSLFGSRYEDLLHYWGLKTQDFRLQEPELVSVGRGRLQFSEVLQTSPDENGAGVGQMAGHGVGAMQSGRFRYYCHEHGYLMTFIVVRPQAVYTQGVERMWTRETRWDYWNPEMQHIGQQEVLSREVYADGTDADLEVFGYQNRFDEYRRGKNHVSGEFRTTQDFWNMARVFENRPVLNSEFISCVPTDRVFQLSESLSDQLYCMINNQLIAKRLLSRNGNPQ